ASRRMRVVDRVACHHGRPRSFFGAPQAAGGVPQGQAREGHRLMGGLAFLCNTVNSALSRNPQVTRARPARSAQHPGCLCLSTKAWRAHRPIGSGLLPPRIISVWIGEVNKRLSDAVALLGLTGALMLTGAAPAGAHTMPAPPVSVTLTSANLRRALSPMPRL